MIYIISLILIGILFIIAEIVFIPGIFVTGFIGVAALVASCYFAFADYGNVWGTVVVAVDALLLLFFTVMALRSKTWKKLALKTEIDSSVDVAPGLKGVKEGDVLLTLTRLAPMGKALAGTVPVEVTAMDDIIEPKREVVVTLIQDNKIYVKTK